MLAMDEFLRAIHEYPVIASLRSEDLLKTVISSRARVVLISSGNILNIENIGQELSRHGKLLLVHVDLIAGLGNDHAAIKFLKERIGVTGIVTPSSHLINYARKEGLIAVQRLFAHDSPSIATGISIFKQSKPHFIEVLPGLAVLRVMSELREHFQQPVIAAGLIRETRDLKLVLKAGAVAADTSAQQLWNLEGLEKEFHIK